MRRKFFFVFHAATLQFLSSKGEEYEEIEDGSELKLGDAPMAPPLNIKNTQASKLGDAKASPLHQPSSGHLR